MAYPCTFPTLFDEVLTINIRSFKPYLQPYQANTGNSRWTHNGQETANIGFSIRMEETIGYLELNYRHKQKPIKYRVLIVSKPSNLGKGLIWYFFCPITKKHCRKLYLVDGYFLHREAFKGMYKCQARSKSSRQLFHTLFARSDFMEGRKYLQTHYLGKPTKSYLRYLDLEKKENQILSQL
ncbi:MAG TPA: hypothetical protein PKC76_09345 [Saprospiraceae bacterium]|nr:hypothetical protein [Saprospiraceae bacterium]HMP24325.1 hypothetical protein [Saprospiraceae bacterium]